MTSKYMLVCPLWVLSALAVGCSGEDLPEILSPANGTNLDNTADLDSTAFGTQLDALVRTSAEPGAPIWIAVSSDAAFTAPALFPGVVASDGHAAVRVSLSRGFSHLRACEDRACKRASPTVTVNASEGVGRCPFVRFDAPAIGGAGVLSLAADDDTALHDGACGTTFATAVRAYVEAENGTPVTLFVDGIPMKTTTVDGGLADFGAVVLGARGAVTSSLHVEMSGCTTAYPRPITVACDGPSCTLALPSGPYLNASLDTDPARPGLDLDLEARALGGAEQAFTLHDAVDGAVLASAGAVREGELATATFRAVQLAEGAQKLDATCTDGTSSTRSAVSEVWVDTVPCSITIESPSEGQTFSDLDDLDHDTANGLQVASALSVSGEGCGDVRIGACSMLDALPFGASAEGSTVTLGTSGTQSVCAEVRDVAGNVGTATLDVFTALVAAPVVSITSPTSSTRFNREGGSYEGVVYEADADPATSSCEVDVLVACSAVGTEVELSLDGAQSALFASCIADPAAPSSGRALFRAISVPAALIPVHTLVARQSIAGFVGTSATRTFGADCAPPTLAVISPACGSTLSPSNDTSPAPGLDVDIMVSTGNGPALDVDLRVRRPGFAGETTRKSVGATQPPSSTQRVFASVGVGGAGTVSVSAESRDSFANLGTSLPCSMSVVGVPALTLDALATTRFNYTNIDSFECDEARAGLDLTISGKTNATAGSQVSLRIGTATEVVAGVVSGAGGNVFTACVPAPEGAQLVMARVEDLDATDGVSGVAAALPLAIRVRSLPLTRAIDDVTVAITDRRAGIARLSFTALDDEEDAPSALARYEVRCADAPITSSLAWAMAAPLTVDPHVPAAPHALDTITVRSIRTGTAPRCAVRGVDDAENLTPLPDEEGQPVVSPQFLAFTIDATRMNGAMGSSGARPVGDVNGDALPDFIVSGQSSAYLVLGAAAGAPPRLATTFTKAQTSVYFGSVVRGLGDFDADGFDDIAIADPVEAGFGFDGEIYVLYGRASWPETITLDEATCAASFCVRGALGGSDLVGFDVAGLGNFDGAEGDDVAIAMPGTDRVLILSGRSDIAPGTSYVLGATDPRGALIAGPSTDHTFAVSLGAPGDVSGSSHADLIITRADPESGASHATLFRVDGRALGAGLEVVSGAEIVSILSDASLPSAFGATDLFGLGFGDFDADGHVDLVASSNAGGTTEQGAFVVYGNATGSYPFTANATRVVAAANAPDAALFGMSRGFAFDPSFGHLGDLDGDGADELLFGAVSATNAGSHSAVLVYGSHMRAASMLALADADARTVILVPVVEPHPASAPRPVWNVAFVGDVIADTTHPYGDLLITDPGTNAQGLPGDRGRVFVLY